MTTTETQAYVAEWRTMEDRFYRAVMGAAELYMLGIRLVRAIADTLAPVDDLAALVERFQRTGTDDVIPIADALDAPQVVLLDYQLALGAAFYLRAQQIQEARADADLRQRKVSVPVIDSLAPVGQRLDLRSNRHGESTDGR